MSQEIDRFRILRVLGSGGMGVVYEAEDSASGARVALKTLAAVDPSSIYRIKREFRSLAGTSHPNWVKLFELGTHEGDWFIAMELVDGVDFHTWVRPLAPPLDAERAGAPTQARAGAPAQAPAVISEVRIRESFDDHVATEMASEFEEEEPTQTGPNPFASALLPPPAPAPRFGGSLEQSIELASSGGFDEGRLRPSLLQLAEGVAALHGSGRLHRDLKPSNVLVTREGRVVILDFGLATEMWEQAILRSTHAGEIRGTIAYMSPEQAGGATLGPASDWYSVGVMLYEALTGKVPFLGAPLAMLLEKQRSDPPAPHELEPGVPEDLSRLSLDLMARAPGERPRPDEILSRLGRAAPARGTQLGKAPFVGREKEMAELHALYDRSGRGGASALVMSEPGMGKTALVEQLIDEVSGTAPAPVVLFGRCYEGEKLPFKAVDALVDALVRRLLLLPAHEVPGLFGPDAEILVGIFPVLRRLPGLDAFPAGRTAVGPVAEQRRRAFDALKLALSGLARHRPLLVVVEDLQFGDLDSARLFAHLLEPPHAVPMLLLGTARKGEATAKAIVEVVSAAALRSNLPTLMLELRPLERPAAERFAEALLSSSPGTLGWGGAISERAVELAQDAGGNPLLMQELVSLTPDTLASGRLPEEGEAKLAALLAQRVDELGADEARVLSVLAVATGPLPIAIVVGSAGVARDPKGTIASLCEARLAVRDPRDQTQIEIANPELREAALSQMDIAERAEVHAAIVRTMLAAEASMDPRVLVLHLRAAGDDARAARVAFTAAEVAFDGLAFEKAAELYRTCLELSDRSSVVEWSLLERLGDCLAYAGRAPKAAESYLEAARASRPGEALRLERKAAEQLLGSGHFDRGREVAEKVLTELGMSFPKSRRAALRGAGLDRLQLKVRGLSVQLKSEISEPDLRRLEACWTLASGLALLDLPRCVYFVGKMLSAALDAGHAESLLKALVAEALLISGSSRETSYLAKIFGALRQVAQRVETPYARALVQLADGFSRYLRGRWSGGEEGLGAALKVLSHECQNVVWEINTCRLMYLEAISWQGRLTDLPAPLASARTIAEETGNLYALTTLRVCPRLTVLHLVADRPERLEDEVRSAMADWPERGFSVARLYAMESAAMAALYRGDARSAYLRVEGEWSALEASGLMRVGLIELEAWTIRGRVALAAGRADRSARKVARQAAEALRAMSGILSAPAEYELLEGQRRWVRGQDEEATACFVRAEEGFRVAEQTLHGALARLGRGLTQGGADEALRVAETAAVFRSLGVKKPGAFLAAFAPALAARAPFADRRTVST